MRVGEHPVAVHDFQREVDDLMTAQDRETRQLKSEKKGLARIEQSAREGERALAEMRQALETAEQEVAVLKARREKAEVESSTLDMIASVTSRGQSAAAEMGSGVERLKKDVEHPEARNQARRDLAPATEREPSNRLSRTWSRLEELKKYSDEAGTTQTTPAASAAGSGATEKKAADAIGDKRGREPEVVIQIHASTGICEGRG